MSNINVVTLSGRLGTDPQMRFTPKGQAVTNFPIAVNEAWNDEEGKRQERVNWVTVEAWNRVAEVAQEYLHKGSTITLSGKLREDTWESQDGSKRSRLKVVVRDMQLPPKGENPSEETEDKPKPPELDAPF